MSLTVDLPTGRQAFLAQADRLLAAVEALDDHALLAASRCHGWAVVDVVVHVRTGLEEMLRGVAAPTAAEPTVDAATYWSSWAAGAAGDDPVDGILWTRRTASAYRSPSGAVRHLRAATEAITGAAEQLSGDARGFQGHVLTAGDFLASWAVELAVHHLDLGRDLDVGRPDPRALHLTRRTVEALLGHPVDAAVDDADVALIGAGRVPAPEGLPIRTVLG